MPQIVIAKASAPLGSGRVDAVHIEVAANGFVLRVYRAGSGPGNYEASGPGNYEVFRSKEDLLSRLSEILGGPKQGKAKAAPPEEEEPEVPEEEEPEEEE
jgi:hypothetical protein